MEKHVELLNGGLVTSRDPTLLDPGELSECANAIYKPSSQALHHFTGWSLFATASAGGTIAGIRAARFDNGTNVLVAQVGSNYYTANVGDTGTFSLLEAVTAGSALEAAQYDNRYFLFNGANANRVLRQNTTTRAHGLQPVTETPGAVTGAGTWSAEATGYYEYWSTEVYKITASGDPENTELESTFRADPKTVYVTSTSQKVTVFRPASVNSTATHWRVYRSPRKERETEQQFPAGFLLAELPVSAVSFDDGSTSSVQAFPTAVGTPDEWTSSSNLFSDNGVNATVAFSTADQALSIKSVVLSGFALTGIADPVGGIEVIVEAQKGGASELVILSAALSKDGGSTWTTQKNIPLSSSMTVRTVGGANEKWDEDWTAADFGSNFRLRLRAMKISGASTITMDYAQVRVNYNGTPADIEGTEFPAVSVEIAGQSIAEGANGEPPMSSFGTIFEDSLVCNDVSNPSLLRYSLAGQPEYFPKLTYFIDMNDTEYNGPLSYCGVLGNILVVGLEHALWRLNYLPRDLNSSFERGRAKDQISKNHGIVGPMAATSFTGPNGRTEIAFVDTYGLFATDGYTVRQLSGDLDWGSTVDITNLDSAVLINNPELFELILFYRPAGQSGITKELHFSYHNTHIKQGKEPLKTSGPVHIAHASGANLAYPSAATLATRTDGTYSLYTAYSGHVDAGGGSVYRRTGTTTPFTGASYNAGITTRRMYIGGLGNETHVNTAYIYHQNPSATKTFTATFKNLKTNDQERTVKTKDITTANSGLDRLAFVSTVEGLRVSIADTNIGDYALDFMAFDHSPAGEEDSGK